MKINKVKKTIEGDKVKLSSKIETSQGVEDLWFTVDKKYEEYTVHETLDAFLLGLFIHAMKLNEDIYLDAPVSERLYYNLTNNIIKIYSVLNPDFHEITIHPKELNYTQMNAGSKNVVTGFSGGIDSFSLLKDYYFDDIKTPHYKVTHLIYNNVGAHGNNAQEFFDKRYDFLRKFEEEVNLPFIKIDSNLHEILDSGFMLSVLPRNIASVMVLQKLFSKYLYASSYTYKDFLTTEIFKIGYTEPLTCGLFSTESMECVLAGSELTRVEKTKQVASLEASHKHLYVCTNTSLDEVRNCSVCFKCSRTLLTLEILGLQYLYKDVFDIEKFNKIKRSYIESVLYEKDPFAMEILQLAAENNYRIPPISKFLGRKYVFPVAQGIRKNVPYSLRKNVKKIVGLDKL
ncbi:MAG: hypothetical protein ACQESQ_08355 [Bacteroidota bacterium]